MNKKYKTQKYHPANKNHQKSFYTQPNVLPDQGRCVFSLETWVEAKTTLKIFPCVSR